MSRGRELRNMATDLAYEISKSFVMNDEEYESHNTKIRNKAIDEFATKAIERLEELNCEAWRKDILAIAEELKGGAE
jgi:hypothetical protein